MGYDNDKSLKSRFYRRPSDAESRDLPAPQRRPAPQPQRMHSHGAHPDRKRPERAAPENLIFGIHPVREAIEAGTGIEKIYFRKSAGEVLSPQERAGVGALNALRTQAAEADIHIHEVPVEKLDRLTRHGNHQGVVAVAAAIAYREINELAEAIEAQIEAGEAPVVVVLDSVTDIRNFGAIARSAECAGVAALIVPAKHAAPVNAEAIKSSAGALNLIPVCRAGSLRGAVSLLKGIGMQCVAATEKSNTLIYEVDFVQPTVIVMGAEDRGISRDLLNLCDVQAGIPLAGRIESLNVSAAAAVILFESRRQRFERS